MRGKKDILSESLLKKIQDSDAPMETVEVEKAFPSETRIRIMYRLNQLRCEQKILGKQVGSGKGTWIWWRCDHG